MKMGFKAFLWKGEGDGGGMAERTSVLGQATLAGFLLILFSFIFYSST